MDWSGVVPSELGEGRAKLMGARLVCCRLYASDSPPGFRLATPNVLAGPINAASEESLASIGKAAYGGASAVLPSRGSEGGEYGPSFCMRCPEGGVEGGPGNFDGDLSQMRGLDPLVGLAWLAGESSWGAGTG